MIYFEIIENKNSKTVYYTARRSFPNFFKYIIEFLKARGCIERWIGPTDNRLWIFKIYARRFSTIEEAIKSTNYHADIILNKNNRSEKRIIQTVVYGISKINN